MKVKILDESGHKQFEMSAKQAAQQAQESQAQGRWVFADGAFREHVTEADLEFVDEIVITPELQAG